VPSKAPERRFQTGQELVDALKKVAREMAAEGEVDGQGRPRVSLKLRLALGMAAVVAVTMALVSSYVVNRQYQTMLDQTVEHGASLAKLVAAESAANALAEDWVGIDVLVQDVARALELRGLSVSDRDGVTRVSSSPGGVGQPLPKPTGAAVATREENLSVVRQQGPYGTTFEFETPIRFQGKSIGAVRLGLPEGPLAAATREAWWLMLLLLAVTAATVGLATYLLVERYSKPLRTLRESLEDIAAGGSRAASARRGATISASCTALSMPWRPSCRRTRKPPRRQRERRTRHRPARIFHEHWRRGRAESRPAAAPTKRRRRLRLLQLLRPPVELDRLLALGARELVARIEGEHLIPLADRRREILFPERRLCGPGMHVDGASRRRRIDGGSRSGRR
jgi:hypothetical protein